MPQDYDLSEIHLRADQKDLLAPQSNVITESARQGLYSAAYSGMQAPVSAIAQVVDRTAGTSIEKTVGIMPAPEPSEFGTAQWHAQQIGGAAGMLVPFMLVAKGTRAGAAKLLGPEVAANASGQAFFSSRNGRLIAEGAVAGFVYDSALRPVSQQEVLHARESQNNHDSGPVTAAEFWSIKAKHGISGAATFGTLTASTLALRHGGIGSLSQRHENIISGILSGAPAGIVNAEVTSLLEKGKLADTKQLASSAYTMSFIGGAMGALHPIAKEQSVARESAEQQSAKTARITDSVEKPEATGYILPERSLSMRELAANDRAEMRKVLENYYPELEKAFPLEGEIESTQTYEQYLTDPESTWDMVVLRDSENKITGGIQYQVLDVPGSEVGKIAWAEHIWVKQENRNYDNFRALLNVARERIAGDGAKMVFMEFNNPKKMTPEEIAIDAEGGITTQDRAKIWGRVGIHVAVDSQGRIAEYGQPSMDGQPAVEFLSLGFVGLEPLTGKTISARDYINIAQAAHSTIPGVDLATDPTVQMYTKSVLSIGESTLKFKPLMELVRQEQARKE